MTQPPANLTSLRARLRNHARDVRSLEVRVQRRLAALVVNEIFTSVDTGAAPPVLLKGGTALDLRRGPAPARLSKDWDAAVRGDLDEFIEKAREQLAVGWAGFTGLMAREETIQVPGLATQPRRFAVKLSYRGKPFVTVPVEVSATEAHGGDEHDVLRVTEYDAIGVAPTGPVYCLSLRYQIAQKIHACTDPLDGERINDRARDLVDLQLLAPLLETDAATLPSVREACVEIFTSRARHSWPPQVTVWPHWPGLYAAAAAEVQDDVLADIEQAAEGLRDFMGELDKTRAGWTQVQLRRSVRRRVADRAKMAPRPRGRELAAPRCGHGTSLEGPRPARRDGTDNRPR